ncbi:hypothetical protein AYO40_00040 [Planctomycetaceae bacterium SCGC AG-212-D15]|nr:hypothetical protein AYO40_00040 [Planctomycetaceae bacterium SCGC AG-212-D15]
MVRKRLAFLAGVVAPALLTAGCTSSNPCCPNERPSFFERFRRQPRAECCEGAAMSPVTDGPVLTTDQAVAPAPPPGGGACTTPQMAPAPTPRLVPTPSQPRAYAPVPQ